MKSFESFLTYDAPTALKKMKKERTSLSRSGRSKSSSRVSKANGTGRNKKRRASRDGPAAAPAKRQRVVDTVPALPQIPLPEPGKKRCNSKTPVCSGSKSNTSALARMTTLPERWLLNNIDSFAKVDRVPMEILEPVLERCTPEQLQRIEQRNQWLMEDTDKLWMRHCQRVFKRGSPQEDESWREMYPRLHAEREEKLRGLILVIGSAHANKLKDRQVKMAFVNSVVKPPRDVRRQQEKFGTAGSLSIAAASPMMAKAVKVFQNRFSHRWRGKD